MPPAACSERLGGLTSPTCESVSHLRDRERSRLDPYGCARPDIPPHRAVVESAPGSCPVQPRTAAQEAMRHDSLNAHTPVEEVGKIAEAAQVSTLVLNHIVPGNAHADDLAPAQRGFSGRLVIGEDLLQFGVGGIRH